MLEKKIDTSQPQQQPTQSVESRAMHTGAKSRTQKAPGDEETGLVFISFKDPTQAKSSLSRKAVRSHITRRQHRQNREHKARLALSQNTEASKPESSTTAATTVAGDIARSPSPRPVLAPPRLDMTFIPAELRVFVLGCLVCRVQRRCEEQHS